MARRRKSRRPRRSRRRNVRRVRLSAAPPRQGLQANARQLNVAYAYSVTATNRKDIFFSSVFKFPPNLGLTYQFREGRVNSARVYYQSDSSTGDSGSVCLTVESYGENQGTDTCDFEEAISYPGAMVRRVWQNVSNRWYPTSPSDREYSSLTGGAGIMTITVRHSAKDSALKGRVLIYLNVTVRGKDVDRCKKATRALELLESNSHPELFEHLNMSELDESMPYP